MIPDDPNTTDDAELLEAQQELLEASLPLVFTAYEDAVASGKSPAVVILLDCEDEIGGVIACSWLGEEAVEEALGQQDADSTAVFAYGFSFVDCAAEIPAVFPYLTPVFEQSPPDDGFLAVVVAYGGASALTVPFSANPGPENA